MKKVLTFDGSPRSQDRLRFLHNGLCVCPKPQARDLETLRREGELLRKLEEISEPDQTAAAGVRFQYVPRVLKAPAEIIVEQADLNLLRDYMLATPWTTLVAGVVVDAIEWAMAAPEVKE